MDSTLNFHKNSSYKSIHFYFTQIPILVFLEIASVFFYIQISDKFIYSFYCLPSIFIYLFILNKCGWGADWRQLPRRIFFSMIGLFIFLPLFFAVYVLVWDPTLSIKWYKSYNCKVYGQYTTQLGNLEKYGLQYVHVNQDLKGISCVSNFKTTGSSMKGYDFYKQGEFYSCVNGFNSTEISESSSQNNLYNAGKRFLEENNEQISISNDINSKNYLTQNTQNGINQQSNISAVKNQQDLPQKRLSSLTKRCRAQYNFSKVKIPSWLCSSVEDNEEILKNAISNYPVDKTCYYAYYGSRDKAKSNGRDISIDLKQQNDFIIVRFDQEQYFYKEGFVCLIIFAMFPALLFSLQAPFSYLVYKLMLFFYKESIKEENEEFKQQQIELHIIKQNKQIDDNDVNSTSNTERQKRKIEPHQIVQILSPNSQQKDRDFYDIYNNTCRKTQVPQSFINPTIMVHTEEPINITKFNVTDTTKAEMIQKKNIHKSAAKSIDEIDDYKGEIINGPRNRTQKSNDDSSSSSDEDANDQDCSYIKIRSIYKKKLNPNYQKEKKKKIQQGEKFENEEKKIIEEMKLKSQEVAEKYKLSKSQRKRKRNKQNQENNNNNNNNDQQNNDYVNIMDESNVSPGLKKYLQEDKVQEKIENSTQENSKNEEKIKQKQESIIEQKIVESDQNENKQNEDDEQIKKLQKAYDIYTDQINNNNEKNINTPPEQGSQLIE